MAEASSTVTRRVGKHGLSGANAPPLYEKTNHTTLHTHTTFISIGNKAGFLRRGYVEDGQAQGLGNHDCRA